MAASNESDPVDSVISESDVPMNQVSMGDRGGGGDHASAGWTVVRSGYLSNGV
ncbi:hypothetical protein AB4305_22825 [Nocardia sp. 2YAB30]|uniref:hypothetical protein n=1 Tax=Nocardia sp. 2YAB30 TaxID=3233022 RepID=UPI003F96F06D